MEERAEEQPLVGGEIRSSICRTRKSAIWPICYSTAVAVIASFSFGYILAFSSPALSDLKEYNGTYTSFSETIYQDIFGVHTSNNIPLYNDYCCAIYLLTFNRYIHCL